jgi:hypothetical protein
MDQTYSPATTELGSLPSIKKGMVIGAATVLFIAFVAFLSLYQQRPPRAVSAAAPVGQFSSGRAMKQLEVISQKPHPMGSLEHKQVRDYIIREITAMGVQPEVQKTTSLDPQWAGPVRAGSVQNIFARIEGTQNTKAVMLVGHYDSVPSSPGASDDGVGVVTLLETMRALKANPPLKNDVIFLFTDGEEAWMLGSNAFVNEHPWAREVGLVLNFEARGSSGPAIMFETSNNNGWLIKEFAEAAPHPISHSLAYEIYRILPNDTDLSVFKKAGYAGMNFAFINDSTHYHTLLDNLARTDERSLQHQGSYALALTSRFGNLDLRETRAPNAVYFDVLGLRLIHYSSRLVVPLTLIVVLLFAGVVTFGLRRKKLTLRGIAFGFTAFLASMIVGPAVIMLIWKIVSLIQGGGIWKPEGETYGGDLYLTGFAAITIALTSALYFVFNKKSSLENLMVGALLWWVILMIATSLFLPGASYLFTWPLIFSIGGLGIMLSAKSREPLTVKHFLLLAICSAVGIIMLVPTIYQTFTGLTLRLIGPVIVLLVLLLGLLLPHLNMLGKWLPRGAAIVGLGIILFATLTNGYSADRPKLNDIFYGLNADSGKAIWASAEMDQWTSQFHSQNAEKAAVPEFLTASSGRPWRTDAPAVALAAPEISMLGESSNNGLRTLRMHVTSPRRATVITIYVDSEVEVIRASVNNRQIDETKSPAALGRKKQWSLRYYALPSEGIDLTTEIRSMEPVKIRAVDLSYGIPEIPGKTLQPRPPHMIPAPVSVNDTTLVSKSFTF